MDEQHPGKVKVVDRRPFNSDGTPRDLPPEARTEPEHPADLSTPAVAETAPQTPNSAPSIASEAAPQPRDTARPEAPARSPAAEMQDEREHSHAGGDPLDDPASFLSLIMSLASNAAACLGMMPHPVTGETGVDLRTAKHWIDVLGMLEQKTRGNVNAQEAQVFEGLLADLRMQFVSLQNSPSPPPSKFSATDITGGA